MDKNASALLERKFFIEAFSTNADASFNSLEANMSSIIYVEYLERAIAYIPHYKELQQVSWTGLF